MSNGGNVSEDGSMILRAPWIRGRKSASMWVFAALSGGIAISVFSSSQYVFFRLILPVIIISGYAWYSLKDAQHLSHLPVLQNVRLGQIADSIYFLGFLWTLWALIDSFVLHNLSIAEAVFRAFGYALVTTASGMFLRLALLQFSYSLPEQMQEGELTIEEEIARFSGEIGKAVTALQGYRSGLDHSVKSFEKASGALLDSATLLEDSIKTTKGLVDELPRKLTGEFSAKVDEALTSHVGRLEQSISRGVTEIDKQTQAVQTDFLTNQQRLKTSIESVEKSTVHLVETLPKQMKAFVAGLEQVSQQIRDIRVSPDVVERTLVKEARDLVGGLTGNVTRLERALVALTQSIAVANQLHSDGSRSWWKKISESFRRQSS